MAKINFKSIYKLVFIFLLYRMIATDRQGIFKVTYWDKYIYAIICCIFLFCVSLLIGKDHKLRISRKFFEISLLMIVPIFIMWCYSIVLNLSSPVEYSGFLSRSFSNVAFVALAVIQAALTVIVFKEETAKLVFAAYFMSFLTSIIVAFRESGLEQFKAMLFDSTFNGSVLEMSELLPAICLFLFYFIYSVSQNGFKKNIGLIFLSLVILIIGMKRILLVASIITFLLYLFLKRNDKRIQLRSLWITGGVIVTVYIYLFLIKTEQLFIILDNNGVNTMARAEIWRGINSTFEFTPLFLGHGLGYGTLWMDNNWFYLKIIGLTSTTGIHNDFLNYFIDLGFFGLAAYLFFIMYIVTNSIRKKIGTRVATLYFLLLIVQLLCWFTDNVSHFHIFLFPFYTLVFAEILKIETS